MREMLETNKEILKKLDYLEKRDIEHDDKIILIFEYLRQHSDGGFEVIKQNGKFYVKINDVNKLQKASSELLKIVHDAKATGDKKTADEYLTKYGNQFNKEWRDNIIARANQIQLPRLVAMVFPKMIPVFKDGKIEDIKLQNNETFQQQQLRYVCLVASQIRSCARHSKYKFGYRLECCWATRYSKYQRVHNQRFL